MTDLKQPGLNRRLFLSATAGALVASTAARAQDNSTEFVAPATGPVNNISSFRMLDWRGHFSSLRNGAILADLHVARGAISGPKTARLTGFTPRPCR